MEENSSKAYGRLICLSKNNLKMQKGYSEDVYRRGTDNIMNQKKKDKWVNRALHRKL
jgi:hypothetical protein